VLNIFGRPTIYRLDVYLPVQFFQKNKSLIRWVNRALAVLAVLWLVRYWTKIQPELMFQYFHKPGIFTYLLPVLLLTLVNWWLETLKWRYLIVSVMPGISFFESLKSVLVGLTLGIVSPNRTGEVLGRVFSLPFPKRFPGFVFHACGSFSQFTATLLIGGGFSLYYGLNTAHSFWQNWGMVAFGTGILFILMLLFPGIILQKVDLIVMRWGVSAKEIGALHRNLFFLPAILFSLLRFLVYSFQLCLLWYNFDPSVSFFTIFTLTSVMYMAVSVIPSMAISEIGIRGAVLVHLAESSGLDSTPAVLAAACLWLINVAVPAAIGIIPLQKIEWFQVKK
jgi:hypothetical protein